MPPAQRGQQTSGTDDADDPPNPRRAAEPAPSRSPRSPNPKPANRTRRTPTPSPSSTPQHSTEHSAEPRAPHAPQEYPGTPYPQYTKNPKYSLKAPHTNTHKHPHHNDDKPPHNETTSSNDESASEQRMGVRNDCGRSQRRQLSGSMTRAHPPEGLSTTNAGPWGRWYERRYERRGTVTSRRAPGGRRRAPRRPLRAVRAAAREPLDAGDERGLRQRLRQHL